MNVVYIAARYHTNQLPIMRGWLAGGHKVTFISQFQAGVEDHTVLQPVILGYSAIFKAIYWIYRKLLGRRFDQSTTPYTFQALYGFPPIWKLGKILKQAKPDLVILRDRSVYNVGAYIVCSFFGYKSILYNQTPMWEVEKEQLSFVHRIFRKFTPKIRMTPVMGKQEVGKVIRSNSHYIPFVMEPVQSFEEKKYLEGNRIHILSIGKFEPRKNHLMLLACVKNLQKEVNLPIEVTLVGELSTQAHRTHIEKIKTFIRENQLDQSVCIKSNLTRAEVDIEYKRADVFVLPSTQEFASVSQLEAMACSLPVVCSDTNGTAYYVSDQENGYLFQDNNQTDLEEKLRCLLMEAARIPDMGKRSYELVQELYSFHNYEKAVKKL